MDDPVKIQVEVNDLATLIQRARECAEDLIAEVEAAYQGDHPVTVRQRQRNTETARKLLSSLPELSAKYRVSGSEG